MNTPDSMRVSYRTLINMRIALEATGAARSHLYHQVGHVMPVGFKCLAWNRDGRGNYHYLVIAPLQGEKVANIAPDAQDFYNEADYAAAVAEWKLSHRE